ncbi:apolipoprotein N-acyltransferase [Nitrosomonas halophila]|uniref:Apolipoprotein N-acyltransferase n=1 Tax=Nitrosomonas halophila TaxID=44576 RepID=A0A1H3J494_9PROT|nr:apolipoprotein N-acyltransferase [Nitrosomonas halophila]SDY34840.1 apolipoprotein N-acyltransferase [Nitrosomonas halophila]
MNISRKLLLALLLGGLTVPGFAPFYIFPLPLFTLALLGLMWRKCTKPSQAALLGFAFGMGMFGAGVTWIYVSLHDFGNMPMPLAVFALIVLCAYLSLFPALTGWIASLQLLRASWVWPGIVAALWALSEWLRGTLFTGFPWLAVGYSQAPYGPLSGFAPVVGVYGVSLLLMLSAAWLACWLENRQARRVVAALASVWVIGLGLQQVSWVKPVGKPVTVSLLQGNIPQDLKWRPEYLATTMQTYVQMVKSSPSRLIVTPEISFPLFREQAPPDYLSMLAEHARANQGDVLIGMAEQDAASNGRYYNTMFSFGTSPEQYYRKHHLVPFGEFIPLKPIFGWIIEVMDMPLADFARGGLDQRPLALAGQRVAINICYEDVFGEEIILQLPEATLLVNVSNDAWFGRSIGPWQHMQISQMRAQETGRYMLRATNTGMTAIIDERGRVVAQLDMFITAGLHGMAQGFIGTTPYVRYGNKLILGLIALLLLAGSCLAFFGGRKTL